MADSETSASQIQGNVSHDSPDKGLPAKIGGYASYNSPTAVAVGDRVNGWFSLNGAQASVIADKNGNTFDAGVLTSDGVGTAALVFPTTSYNFVYNGATFDRMRGDTTGTYVVNKAATSGGLSATRVVTGTSGVIKASAGQLFKLHSVRNANAAVRYLHLYDKATAPTLSTDTPVLTISLAASSIQNDINIGGDIGVAFANGIAWAYTTDNVAIPTTAGTSTELMFSGAFK